MHDYLNQLGGAEWLTHLQFWDRLGYLQPLQWNIFYLSEKVNSSKIADGVFMHKIAA